MKKKPVLIVDINKYCKDKKKPDLKKPSFKITKEINTYFNFVNCWFYSTGHITHPIWKKIHLDLKWMEETRKLLHNKALGSISAKKGSKIDKKLERYICKAIYFFKNRNEKDVRSTIIQKIIEKVCYKKFKTSGKEVKVYFNNIEGEELEKELKKLEMIQ